VQVGEAAVIDTAALDALIGELTSLGYRTLGPVVREGAIVPGPISGAWDLPIGWNDEQSPGGYRMRRDGGRALFAWAVGPGSWKAELFPPVQEVWRGDRQGDRVTLRQTVEPVDDAPLALIGARPCELVALHVLDRVLERGAVGDPRYAGRRAGAFVLVAECGRPASTCFCTSMGTGPAAAAGFDLALAELDDGGGHRFVVRVGTERGAEVLSQVTTSPATPADLRARQEVLQGAERRIERRLPLEGLVERLGERADHPRWTEVAERCLSCGNCTLVCPTCFCCDVDDTSGLGGELRRERRWASCFDLGHSYLHGGPVRSSTASRYRQWATHKLSTWWDQFGTSGCVGCGRCITWCPAGIDLTEEVAVVCAGDPVHAREDDVSRGAPR
jgi:sulfhydrogenase subunit beta (sulfur reductase)